jgi:hypothetical protein
MDYFDKKAREKERAFFRKLRNRSFSTGNGKENEIKEVTDSAVIFQTAKSVNPHRISRVKLRQAIRHMFFRRTAVRIDLEKYSSYSSALLGLLVRIFRDVCRLDRTVKGALRISLKSVRYFCSGADKSVRDVRLAAINGQKFFLVSYFYVRSKKNWDKIFRELSDKYGGVYVLLDSGAFSASEAIKKGKSIEPLRVQEYCEFIKKYQDLLYGYIALDNMNDPEETKSNYQYMKEQGLSPIPVFSKNAPWDELRDIIQEDVECVAIGSTARLSEKQKNKFCQDLFRLFPSQLFHLLGSASPVILTFPFFSSDAITLFLSRKFRFILTPRQQLAPENWHPEYCLAFNANYLKSLEDLYEPFMQLELPLAL